MSNDEQEIRQLVANWMAATKAGDADKVLSMITDDVVFLLPGKMMRHDEFAAAVRAQASQVGNTGGAPPTIDGKSDVQEIKVLGDWAFMWTNLTVTVTPSGGSTTTRSGHTMTIFTKRDGKWLLARDANLLAPLGG